MSRVGHRQLEAIDAGLSVRQRQLVSAVADFRLISSVQLRRVLELQHPELLQDLASAHRLIRLDLASLTTQRCLHRMERRIGGKRAGSAGHVYALGAVGQRLVDLWAGHGVSSPRSTYEPHLGFQDHALGVVDAVLTSVAATKAVGGQASYTLEPTCWRRYPSAGGARLTLKPDAELHLDFADYQDRWWLELDRGTERRSTVRRKLLSCTDYFRSGIEHQTHGVFPITAWVVPSTNRAAVVRDEVQRLPEDERPLFAVTTLPQLGQLLTTGIGGTS